MGHGCPVADVVDSVVEPRPIRLEVLAVMISSEEHEELGIMLYLSFHLICIAIMVNLHKPNVGSESLEIKGTGS